ncbi:MAG: PilT/PilU family type 4a pilus ATPase [Desulfobacterales bacterium]|nr:PilT/PilU family type 4a pilus ATPase [Desulfobacterales bacterium]MBF0397784.1 PilT/PilU family type 4a pilus ATPase [Desulfobacterales bacterium]
MEKKKLFHTLLEKAVNAGASDLHLTKGVPPVLRINGELIMMNSDPLNPELIKQIIYSMLNENQKAKFEQELELCYSLTIEDIGYFRVTIYYHRGDVEAAIRIGMSEAKSIKELGLPPVMMDLTRKPNGLILITGATGHGKTTTLNALIDFVNKDRRCKIITVEDPVEYMHKNNKSIIIQQELHTDTKTFHQALRHILRQNPDIIGIGEMRDIETISAAVTAAETGHLVISTLHTNDCSQTISRIIDVFPSHHQEQIRLQLSAALVCIINQRLLPQADKKGRVLAYEFMMATDAVRNYIRENKLHMLINAIISGRNFGMIPMDEMIKSYYQKAIISYDTAISNMRDPKALKNNQGN